MPALWALHRRDKDLRQQRRHTSILLQSLVDDRVDGNAAYALGQLAERLDDEQVRSGLLRLVAGSGLPGTPGGGATAPPVEPGADPGLGECQYPGAGE